MRQLWVGVDGVAVAELIFCLFIIGVVAAVLALRDNSNPAALWVWGWAIFAAMAVFIRGAAGVSWAPMASPLLSPLLPAFMLAGALAYADRPVPTWLLPVGLAVGVLRWGLVQVGYPQGSHAIAILLEPAITLIAAWLVFRAHCGPEKKLAQHFLAPALLAVAGIDAFIGIIVANGTRSSTGLGASLAGVWLVTLGLQITASGHRTRWLRGQLELEGAQARAALDASEKRFGILAEHASDLITELDSEGRLTYVSPSLRELLGREPAELVGRSGLELVYPEDRPAAVERMEHTREESSQGSYTFRCLHADGSWRWVESSFRSFRKPEGNLGIVSITRDITERKRTQESLRRSHDDLERRVEDRTAQLRQAVEELEGEVAARRRVEEDLHASRERYRIVSELSSDYSFCFNVIEGQRIQCEWVTDAYSKVTGYHLEDLEGDKWRERLDQEQVEMLTALLPAALPGQLVEFEWPFTTKSGDLIWLHSCVSITKAGQDDCYRIVGASREITERKRAEEGQRRLEARLSEVQRRESLGVLAGGVAHDFNNLLGIVLGNAELGLMDVSESSTVGRRLARIRSAALHGAGLTEQMLVYSGKTPYSPVPTDLSSVVRETRDLLEASLSDRGTLELDLGRDLPVVAGDETQLRQVVINLVANATESLGDRGGRVEVRTERQMIDEDELVRSIGSSDAAPGEYVVLVVEDSGMGIAEASKDRIFDPFFTTRQSGRGLGLAAVLGIVRAHEGLIFVSSEPEQGTEFRVCFPAREGSVSTSASGSGADPVARERTAAVLVVDDEQGILEVATEFLRASGFSVLTASDGREALSVVAEGGTEIDAVVLDLVMPGMDGEETFRELRRILPDVPVILTSGYDEARASQRFAPGEIACFVSKPYRASELIETVRAVTEG